MELSPYYMTQQLNGTIMIGSFGTDNIGRKVFDLKITNSWPIISISTKQSQFCETLIMLELSYILDYKRGMV